MGVQRSTKNLELFSLTMAMKNFFSLDFFIYKNKATICFYFIIIFSNTYKNNFTNFYTNFKMKLNEMKNKGNIFVLK